MNSKTKQLSTEPYKGTRDFYPEEQFAQNYIFGVWKKVAQQYGYLEYGASILEETDLYRAKSGEEIVKDQTYSFTDRGGRDVTIRPEMTPTIARMVAQKRRELSFPLRWFSIPNLFRYERPQRGRLREHWQLNCDIFGVDTMDADVEIISLAYGIMKEFGAKDEQFEIRLSSRMLFSAIVKALEFSEETGLALSKLLDKKQKMPVVDFLNAFENLLKQAGKEMYVKDLREAFNAKSLDEFRQALPKKATRGVAFGIAEKNLQKVQSSLASSVKNMVFDPSLMRGFDYYTGTVFEVYDKSPENNRSLFGGGRYDDLVSIFGVEKVSGIGFGMGDVTIADFLETYNLLPEYFPPVQLYICHLESHLEAANQLASDLRKQGLNVEVDLTDRQVSKQVKTADKEKIPFVVVVGEQEVKSGKFKVKSLKESTEQELTKDTIAGFIKAK